MQVKRTDLAPAASLPPAPVITIGADKLWFDMRPIDLGDVGSMFIHARTQADMKSYYLQVGPDVPWSRVVDVVKVGVELKWTQVALAFEVTPPPLPPPPPRAAIDAKLDEIMKTARATQLAQEMSKLVSDCAPVKKVFGAVSSDSGEDKADMIIEGLGEALPKCDCNVDMASLRSAMWRVIVHAPDVAVIQIDTSPGGDELVLPATMPWSEANTKLTRGQHVTLSVAP
jgi:hypothetical protein